MCGRHDHLVVVFLFNIAPGTTALTTELHLRKETNFVMLSLQDNETGAWRCACICIAYKFGKKKLSTRFNLHFGFEIAR